MKSGSWSSYVAAGALGDGGGPAEESAPPIDTTPDPYDEMGEQGYRAYRDPIDGWWVVGRWTGEPGDSIGEALGSGRTACEAWDDARRRFYGQAAADYQMSPYIPRSEDPGLYGDIW